MQVLDFESPVLELERELDQLRAQTATPDNNLAAEIAMLETELAATKMRIYANLTPWQRVQIARHTNRPFMLDYISLAFTDFCELHGDRLLGDDAAMPGGLARLGDHRVMVIGHQKGRNTKENLQRNFGSAHPEGYRKAMRLMSMAEKFRLPIISLVDTPAADPGVESEERGISEAIAESMMVMFSLTVPVIVVIVGEGGSGGAIGIAAGNRICMLEHSVYSVIPPEGCAAILWRDPTKSAEAAESLKLTADSAKDLGIIDQIIPEPLGGAHRDYNFIASSVKRAILESYEQLRKMSPEEIRDHRYNRFRSLGRYLEASPAKS